MDNNYNLQQEVEENVLAGAVGALLFSLVGGIVWFVLYRIGYVAALSGIIGVVCAIKGYSVFAKKESVKGVVISVIAAALILVAAWYASISYDIFLMYKGWYAAGEIIYCPDYFECLATTYLFLKDTDLLLRCLGDLAFGLVFCVIGCITPIRNALNKARGVKNAPIISNAGAIRSESVRDETEE